MLFEKASELNLKVDDPSMTGCVGLKCSMVKDTTWCLVRLTVSAKNVDQWCDELVPAVTCEDGAETFSVHMSSTSILVTAGKSLSKGRLANVRRHHKKTYRTADGRH
jgi:hypothetical protein